MQIQADVLGIAVERPAVVETTALGAALLAGLAAGFFANASAVVDARRIERRFEPQTTAETRRRMLATWQDAVERSRGWARPR